MFSDNSGQKVSKTFEPTPNDILGGLSLSSDLCEIKERVKGRTLTEDENAVILDEYPESIIVVSALIEYQVLNSSQIERMVYEFRGHQFSGGMFVYRLLTENQQLTSDHIDALLVEGLYDQQLVLSLAKNQRLFTHHIDNVLIEYPADQEILNALLECQDLDSDQEHKAINPPPSKSGIIDISLYSFDGQRSMADYQAITDLDTGIISGTVNGYVQGAGSVSTSYRYEFDYGPRTNTLTVLIPIDFQPVLGEVGLEEVNEAIENHIGDMYFLDGAGKMVQVDIRVVPTSHPSRRPNRVTIHRNSGKSDAKNWYWEEGESFDGVIAQKIGLLLGLEEEYWEGPSDGSHWGVPGSFMISTEEDSTWKPQHALGFMALVAGITGKPSIADRIADEMILQADNGEALVIEELSTLLNLSYQEAQFMSLKYGQGEPLDREAIKSAAQDSALFYDYGCVKSGLCVNLDNTRFSYRELAALLGLEDTGQYEPGGRVDLCLIKMVIGLGGLTISTDEEGLTKLMISEGRIDLPAILVLTDFEIAIPEEGVEIPEGSMIAQDEIKVITEMSNLIKMIAGTYRTSERRTEKIS